jgi:hypothetical protein
VLNLFHFISVRFLDAQLLLLYRVIFRFVTLQQIMLYIWSGPNKNLNLNIQIMVEKTVRGQFIERELNI